jgi:3-deoxy-7-phosphoheptulonate synthase
MQEWSLVSWLKQRYLQAAIYTDEVQLNKVVEQLSLLPPLVTGSEVKLLRKEIARAGRGEAFILQGGDCAESFNDCRSEVISNKLKIILQMSLILSQGLRKPIIRVGRIAGQYAKPRSSDFETIDGVTLPCYRGDLVNSPEFTPKAREPNPHLLLQAYNYSAITLNFIRSLKVDFYTSHEALHLHYEQALTRQLDDGLWYNLSTHLPWIGMRTAQTDSAHLEFLRGVQNPIGIKIGPSATPQWLEEVLTIANPEHKEGRLLLFTRLGANQVDGLLPPLIKAVQRTKIPVTWSCDPMHGNTETTADGIKTRHFDNILLELKQTLEIHHSMGSYLGGVHFELTGDNVTECIGGARGLSTEDLKKAYHSLIDPRLNYEQSIEMALQLSRQFKSKVIDPDSLRAREGIVA